MSLTFKSLLSVDETIVCDHENYQAVLLCATVYYAVQLNISLFIFQISFFENVAAMTLQYLDSLVQRDEMTKSQFFRGLYKVMSKLPKVYNVNHI